jgi:type IV secretion system protein VirD4
MKIDAETLKKQVILHLPYVLFLLVFAKLGEAVRLAPGADASQKLLGLSEGFALAFSCRMGQRTGRLDLCFQRRCPKGI